jgi:hypothetical protein
MSISKAPSHPIVFDRELSVAGRVLRTANIYDEDWLEGDLIPNPAQFVEGVKEARIADIFTFTGAFDELGARLDYPLVMENAAVVRLTTFTEWWEGLPQESRKNVRRSQRRGAMTTVVSYDDKLVEGITAIYNETPIRQGRRFWHYGKQFDTVKKENSSYIDRSIFIGTYVGTELIGFIKIVVVNQIGRIMQILALDREEDKRPTNALLAKAVEACCERGLRYFVYGRYVYGNKESSPMTEFKRRNGFERFNFPRYYAPLTPLGALAVSGGFHLGILQVLPEPILNPLLNMRRSFYARRYAKLSKVNSP